MMFDLAISQAVQSFHPSWLIKTMKAMTDLASPEVLIVVTMVCIAALLYFRRRDPAKVLAMIVLGNLLTIVVKHIVQRPRPIDPSVQVWVHESGYSFPSGHALAIVLAAASVFVLTRNKVWRGVSVLIVFLIGYSRIVLGVHWLTDVIAGYLLAGAWLWIIWHTKNLRQAK